jgi:hypothetical protein
MSRVGDGIARVAELCLWVTAAGLIASSAGMRMPAGVLATLAPTVAAPTGDGSPIAVGSATPKPTPTATLTPAPTRSPLVAKFQAFLARPNFQFVATGNVTIAMNRAGTSMDAKGTVVQNYKSGDCADTTTFSTGAVSRTIVVGNHAYVKGASSDQWIDKPMSPGNGVSERMVFSPTRLFVETGVEDKNGVALHRLEVADPVAFSAEVEAASGGTNVVASITFWVKADGTPVVFRTDTAGDGIDHGVKTHATESQELVLTKLSGVTVTAPKTSWKWVVDDEHAIAFALPRSWASSDANKSKGWTSYASGAYVFSYKTTPSDLDSLDAAVTSIMTSDAQRAATRTKAGMDGLVAVDFGFYGPAGKDFVAESVVQYGGQIYEFTVVGGATPTETATMAAQILNTVKFTK